MSEKPCEHDFDAINQWQTICRKCGVDIESLSRPADSPSDSLAEATVIVRNMLELWQDAVVNLERGAARNLASAKVSVLEDVLAALGERDGGGK